MLGITHGWACHMGLGLGLGLVEDWPGTYKSAAAPARKGINEYSTTEHILPLSTVLLPHDFTSSSTF
jgi:hypothetical protein